MRVYAETNFVLEIVLEQSEVHEATALVELAEQRAIALVLPSAALFETYETVHRRRTERRALVKQIENELLQVGRSLSMANEASQLRGTLVRADALVTQRRDEFVLGPVGGAQRRFVRAGHGQRLRQAIRGRPDVSRQE